MSDRIFNFSAGPAVLPESVLKKAQEAVWNVAGSGIGIMEHSHRGKTFDKIHTEAEQNCRELAGISGRLHRALPPGRRVAPVLDGADESAARRSHGGLPRHRCVVAKGDQGGQGPRPQGARGRHRGGDQLRPASRGQGHPLLGATGLRPSDDQQHDLRDPVAHRAGGPHGRAARRRHLERHVQPTDRRVQVRSDLRGRAEEPGALRRGARHHPERPGRGGAEGSADDAPVPDARGGEVPVQHAAHVRDLRDGRDLQVDQGAGRSQGDGRAERRPRRGCCTTTSTRASSSARRRSRAAAP